jgi:hypothetical protein
MLWNWRDIYWVALMHNETCWNTRLWSIVIVLDLLLRTTRLEDALADCLNFPSIFVILWRLSDMTGWILDHILQETVGSCGATSKINHYICLTLLWRIVNLVLRNNSDFSLQAIDKVVMIVVVHFDLSFSNRSSYISIGLGLLENSTTLRLFVAMSDRVIGCGSIGNLSD